MAIDFPNSPSNNDIYTVNGKRWIYSNGKWSIYGSTSPDATASDTEPTGVGDGHIWYRSDQSQTLIRYDNTWVEIGSAGGFDNASTNFPTSLDSATGFAAVEALQAKVGVDGSAVTTSIDYRLNTLSYQYVQTVYFTSSGTFTKASYPWLRAMKVTVVGGGGGGGGTSADSKTHGGGGGGGGAAIKFITDIAGLSASETVTIGLGGAGNVAADGSAGGWSSAFTLTGNGGGAGVRDDNGTTQGLGGYGGTSSGGDHNMRGDGGAHGSYWGRTNFYGMGGNGGSSIFGGAGRGASNGSGQAAIANSGAGGGGGGNAGNSSARVGGNGANGIVIVELYA
jgi:hypothetical protein